MVRTIPEDFLIGTSSSAWQIEGVAGKSKEQKSWAELFYESAPEKWHDGVGPDKAADFYHRYKEDIHTMASLHMKAFRFTIQWARFMKDPIAGIVDEEAAAYYGDVIKTIREAGMEPLISLEHWDLPAILIERFNGWAGRETLDCYIIYVKEVLQRFADQVTWWFAFTEPNIPIDNGYMDAIWYPFTHDPKTAYQAHFHKILATSYAVACMEQYRSYGCRMGAMVHMTPVYAKSGEIQDVTAAWYADLFHVRLYLDPYLKGEFPAELLHQLQLHDCMFSYKEEDLQHIRAHRIDMLGIDYYFPIRVQARRHPYTGPFHPKLYYEPWIKEDRKFNADRGWEVYEQAVYDIGMRLKHEYGNPDWLISENGIGIAHEERYRNEQGSIDDDYRITFLREHLRYALKAKEAGCHCHGYLVWSYIDNVSAINAFKNRYGLLELDVTTGKRIQKKSAYWFRDILEKMQLDD